MRSTSLLLAMPALILAIAACSTSSPAELATSTSLFSDAASPAPSEMLPVTLEPGTALPVATVLTAASGAEFRVAVIADLTTEQMTQEQAQAVLSEASSYLREFSPIGFTMTGFAGDASGESSGQLATRYLNEHAGARPNGIVIFSAGENGQARASGGYGFMVPAPAGFRNAFVSPQGAGDLVYVAVVDYSYKYMPCGYGGSDAVQSTSALDDECRGQTGIACVANNGYSMCSNAVGNLYTSTPTHAVASMVVHGLLHNFGPNGDQDHYATPECNARMGYPAGFFDLQESEYYNGLCPFVYEEFTKAYRP